MENQNEPANYIADNSQMEAFKAGVQSQQEVGRDAYEREQKALEQMKRHMETVARYMTDPYSVDHNDPAIREILGKRASALSSALRQIR